MLLESSPAADAVLAQAPERLVLRFNEPVRPVLIQLLARDGANIDLAPPEPVDAELRMAPAATLPDGGYVLSYRVTSADGHPVAGSLVFTVGAPDAGVQQASTGAHDRLWSAADVATRALYYGCLLLAAGLALFIAVLPVPESLQAALRAALGWLAAAGLVAGVLRLGATAGALYGGPPDLLLTTPPWHAVLGSPVARSVLVAVLGLGLLGVAAHRGSAWPRAGLLVGAGIVAGSFALAGHAATAGPFWVTLPAITLHTLCAAYWVGAFGPLLVALSRLPRIEAFPLLAAFSRGAVVAVTGLVLAGVALATLQLRAPSALIDTDYGRLLLAKLALVGLMLGLGAFNRSVLTPKRAQHPESVSWLRRTIGTDLALAAGVVALTAGLGTVPPPRALAEQEAALGRDAESYRVVVAERGYQLEMVATPASPGENRIDLHLTDARGAAVHAVGAELSLALPELGIEAIRIAAAPVEHGRFEAHATLPLAGQWQVRADLLIDDFTKLPFQARIAIE